MDEEPAMTFGKTRRRPTTASACGLLLIAIPSYAQNVAAATQESTMASPQQYATPTSTRPRAGSEDTSIHSFRIDIPEAELVELRRRIVATRWPERETV